MTQRRVDADLFFHRLLLKLIRERQIRQLIALFQKPVAFLVPFLRLEMFVLLTDSGILLLP